MKASTLLATLSLLAAGCLWGTGFLFVKIAFEQMTVSENVTFRFIFGSLVLAPVLLKRWRKFCPRDLRLLALAAIIGVPVQFLVQFTGLQWTTVSHASLMVGTLPMIVALNSVILLRERLGRTEWLALLISAAGAAIIALSHSAAGNSPKPSVAGDLLVLLSLVAAAAMIFRESLGAAVVAGGIGSAVYFSLRPPTRPRALPDVTP